MTLKTPPPAIRDVVDQIASRRNVTLYITMECDGSKIHKTTRNYNRALSFMTRHESLGWTLESFSEWQ